MKLREWGAPESNSTSYVLILVGVLVLAQHLVSHMGVFSVFSPGVDDLVVGYPTAAILVLIGLRKLR